jgi:hypothetical protein
MTLDGKTSTTASLVNLPGPADLAYNVTLYNVQSLAETDHTLNVALVDYTFSNGTTMGSLIRFDSAAVNDTTPSVVSPSGVGIATPTPVASAPSNQNGSSGASHPE